MVGEIYALLTLASVVIVICQGIWKMTKDRENKPKKPFIYSVWIAWLFIAGSSLALTPTQGWRWIIVVLAVWASWLTYKEMQYYIAYKDAQKVANAPE